MLYPLYREHPAPGVRQLVCELGLMAPSRRSRVVDSASPARSSGKRCVARFCGSRLPAETQPISCSLPFRFGGDPYMTTSMSSATPWRKATRCAIVACSRPIQVAAVILVASEVPMSRPQGREKKPILKPIQVLKRSGSEGWLRSVEIRRYSQGKLRPEGQDGRLIRESS